MIYNLNNKYNYYKLCCVQIYIKVTTKKTNVFK